MANAYNYSNVAVPTTLAGNISAGATTVSVVSTVGFPAVPFVVAIDFGASTEELMKVTSVAGLALSGTRGFGGTSAQSHSLGAAVRPVYNAQDAIDFRTHEDSTAQHGATGAVVGTTNTQTLTNKTLTSPTINGSTLSGTHTGSPLANLTLQASGAAVTPLTIKGAVSQSDPLTYWRDSSNGFLASMSAGGMLQVNQFISDNGGIFGDDVTISGNLTVDAINTGRKAFKLSDTSRTTTTVTSDPDLSIGLPDASGIYAIEALLNVRGDAAADINVGWSAPAGATGSWTPINFNVTASGNSANVEIVSSLWSAQRTMGLHATPTTPYGVHVRGFIRNNGTSGNLVVQWAAATAGGTGTIMGLGSWLTAEKLV